MESAAAQTAAAATEVVGGTAPDPLAQLQQELTTAKDALAKEKQEHQIERLLVAASVVDVDATRTLVEQAMAGGLDMPQAIAQVRQRSPQLFKPPASVRGAALAPAARPHAASELEAAQREALTCGDRRAVLRYLRLRRQAG